MHHKTEASFSSKVACVCVFGGVLACYLVAEIRHASKQNDLAATANVVKVLEPFDPPSRERPAREAYADFRCDDVTVSGNKLCSMIPPLDIVNTPVPKFLPNYKNPCWKTVGEDQPIRCLPYFYLLAAPRCGSTDIYTRMALHPQIAYVESKDIQWLTRGRYAFPSDGVSTTPTISNYSDCFVNATSDIYANRDINLFHRKIFGDYSVSTFWDNMFAAKIASMTNTSAQRNARLIHHLNPRAKFVVSLRDPVERAYSDYLYFDNEHKKTREIFHEFVEEGIRTHTECLEYQPLQYCIDYRPNNKGKSGRLFVGIYHQHFHDFFEYFPKSQFFIFKLEDYSKDTAKYLRQIYAYLGLGETSESYYSAMLNATVEENLQREASLLLGPMLPETRRLLQEFYRPYNDLLAQLIGQQFNYNVYYNYTPS